MIYIQFTPDGIRAEREPFDGGVAYGEVGEPVAWMYHHPGDIENGWQRFKFDRRIQAYEGMTCEEEDRGVIETPLYTGASANNELIEALKGMLAEWDKFTRYGSPMAKAANERVAFARALLTRVKGATPCLM